MLFLCSKALLLAMVRADDGERKNIENLMEKTFDERRDLVNDVKCSTRLLLFAFPHLKSFEGRMVSVLLVLKWIFTYFA